MMDNNEKEMRLDYEAPFLTELHITDVVCGEGESQKGQDPEVGEHYGD